MKKKNGWNEQFNLYRESNPTLADELEKAITGEVLIEAKDILSFDTENDFTRVASGEAINHYANRFLLFSVEVRSFSFYDDRYKR
ncbi:hypothetical protein ACT7CZ_19095 [Bacillus cereus]